MKVMTAEESAQRLKDCPFELWDLWHSRSVLDDQGCGVEQDNVVPLTIEEVETVAKVVEIFDGQVVFVRRSGSESN